jgi:predicted metal-dependent phosphoesterase TrpH
MKVDLHSHSFYSDGKHAPSYLMSEAETLGITHLAITDHDCIHALMEQDWSLSPLNLIPGVEISANWQGIEVHIVGLSINLNSPELNQLLEIQQQRRWSRVDAMSARLEKLGTPGLREYMNSLDCISASRSHVADFLTSHGLCRNRQKAFKNYLNKRGKIWVQSEWCDISEAVAAIKAAGGISVIAHCSRYPLNKKKRALLVQEFAAQGGDALEVCYPNLEPNLRKELITLADNQNLHYSVGSDFHDASASWTALGKFQPLTESEETKAVWHHKNWSSL